jgi:hypothetical protein
VSTGVGAKQPEVSYHGTKAVFPSYAYQGVGRPSRDGVLDAPAPLRRRGERSAAAGRLSAAGRGREPL